MSTNNENDSLGLVPFKGLSAHEQELQRRKAYKTQVRKARRVQEERRPLTITSLMDAMTILLVFLLVSITSDPLNVTQSDHLLLARSTVDFSPGDDSVPIMINKQHIIVDHQAVVQVDCTVDGRTCSDIPSEDGAERTSIPEGDIQALNYCQRDPAPADCTPEELARLNRIRFRIDESYKQDGDAEQFLIVPLLDRLQQVVKDQKEQSMLLGREFRGIATIIADRNIPFRMLAEVVHTAGMAELGDIRFAVIRTSNR